MPKYIVNLNIGWGGHAHGEEFDSDAPECATAVEQGYLLVTQTPLPDFTKEARTTTLRKAPEPEPEPSGEPI